MSLSHKKSLKTEETTQQMGSDNKSERGEWSGMRGRGRNYSREAIACTKLL
jgi:hypothetical protein